MALIEYNPNNCPSANLASVPMLSITASGEFTLNKGAQQLIGVDQEKPQVKLFQSEEEETTWYICAVKEGGFLLKPTGSPYKDGARRLSFHNSCLLSHVVEACGQPEKGVQILISDEELLEIEETGIAYPLITAVLKRGKNA